MFCFINYICVGIGVWAVLGMGVRFWSVCLLMTKFDCPEMTLCSWQDVKIQKLNTSPHPPSRDDPVRLTGRQNARITYLSLPLSVCLSVSVSPSLPAFSPWYSFISISFISVQTTCFFLSCCWSISCWLFEIQYIFINGQPRGNHANLLERFAMRQL